ncbi:DUF342 domain-containing protein [Gemmatimonas aurantiaca]|nr:DUF342 domain-containing protein [Gemmatimonas aurantiaca]
MNEEPAEQPAQETNTATDDSASRLLVKIASDRLSASVRLTSTVSDTPLTEKEVRSAIQQANVTFGLQNEIIAEFAESGGSKEAVQIAVGAPPQPAQDAILEFLFEVAPNHKPKVDQSGHIDYQEVNFLQGAAEDQVLVRRTPPAPGSPGTGVDNAPVSALEGKDRKLPQGKNTRVSDDNTELIAEASGVVVFAQNQVHVRDVFNINGDVDREQGNIQSPGSVKISGDVKAGFKVQADGDIEIGGNVEDAEVVANGNILIKGGFSGRGEGLVQADGDVTIARVEGQRVIAGHDINIGSDALNAQLSAGSRIFIRSEKGQLFGGEAIAHKEITSPTIGSEAWAVTILRVGGGEKLIAQIKDIEAELERVQADAERIEPTLYQLVKLEIEGKLPEANKDALNELRQFKRDLPENLATLEKKKAAFETELLNLREARITATSMLYPGAMAYFGRVYLDVKEDIESVVLSSESGQIFRARYSPKTVV